MDTLVAWTVQLLLTARRLVEASSFFLIRRGNKSLLQCTEKKFGTLSDAETASLCLMDLLAGGEPLQKVNNMKDNM